MDVGVRPGRRPRCPRKASDYERVSRLLAYALLTGDNGGDQPDRVAQGILAGLTTAEAGGWRRTPRGRAAP